MSNTIMETNKRQRQRLAALPYNYYFLEDVKEARKSVGLPSEGITSPVEWVNWYYLESQKYEPMIITLSHDMNIEKQKIQRHAQWWDSDMPLEKNALELVRLFQLPMRAIRRVSHYILTGDIRWIRKSIGAEIYLSQIYNPAELGLDCRIMIDAWTTKKQWDEIWDSAIEPELVGLQYLAGKPQTRRMSAESWDEQMKRWAEWHKLYELRDVETEGYEQVIEKWQELHPEEKRTYDISTVSKAIRDFEKLVKPIK